MASRAEAWKPTGPIGASTIESLYELHAPRLRRQCLRLTADAAAADDLMQEVFVRFMTRFPDPPAGMNVGAYLHRTARNVLWNQRRDAHEVLVDDLETRLGADDQLERDPERAALLVEQRHLVRRCATLLTRRQRRALTLRDVDGQSYAEIGSELGIGADAVAQVISRARMRLRSVVRREQADLDELQPECRAMLGPLSDYVDGRASSSTPALEAHLAGCERCRHTLASYQEAGLRLRGGAPLVPLAGLLARLGEVVRGGGDGPLGIAAAASIATAAALAVGGGGMLVAQRLTESPSAHRALAVTVPRHAATTVPVRHSIVAVTRSTAPRAPSGKVHHRRAGAVHSGAAHRPGHAAHPAHAPRSTPSTTPAVTPAVASTPAAAPVNSSPSTNAPPTRTTAPTGTSPVTPTTTSPSVVPPATSTTHINSLTTPQVSVPSVSVPSVTTPAVAVPAVTVPPISTPAITTPVGTVPGLTTPTISTPSVTDPTSGDAADHHAGDQDPADHHAEAPVARPGRPRRPGRSTEHRARPWHGGAARAGHPRERRRHQTDADCVQEHVHGRRDPPAGLALHGRRARVIPLNQLASRRRARNGALLLAHRDDVPDYQAQIGTHIPDAAVARVVVGATLPARWVQGPGLPTDVNLVSPDWAAIAA